MELAVAGEVPKIILLRQRRRAVVATGSLWLRSKLDILSALLCGADDGDCESEYEYSVSL